MSLMCHVKGLVPHRCNNVFLCNTPSEPEIQNHPVYLKKVTTCCLERGDEFIPNAITDGKQK